MLPQNCAEFPAENYTVEGLELCGHKPQCDSPKLSADLIPNENIQVFLFQFLKLLCGSGTLNLLHAIFRSQYEIFVLPGLSFICSLYPSLPTPYWQDRRAANY